MKMDGMKQKLLEELIGKLSECDDPMMGEYGEEKPKAKLEIMSVEAKPEEESEEDEDVFGVFSPKKKMKA